MTEQNNPHLPHQNSNSSIGPEGEAPQSPNHRAEPEPVEQAPNAPQQDTPVYGQPSQQTQDYTARQPASAQADPYAPQSSGYGQQPSGQAGAYSAPGYGQSGPSQLGVGQPTFDAYGNQIPSDAKSMALFAHLSGLIGLVVTVSSLNFIGPLIFWFIYKDKPGYQFVRYAAAGAFNFSFTMWLINVAVWILTIATLGIAAVFTWIILLAVWVALIVLHIIAAVKANNGQVYDYPMAIKVLS